ncbi:LacI family transcriptional regulator [Ktedonosporobacter rubrisoli]|uniref:LacI family transcriptional regulator n=1 Tax=Ktedonosporobacter rubrisoli TaxID=2509675 RepID=A0A4P6JI48_KTERU|nr:LacI family DNA-binding transcriptional regulator [Ktedonosporobacter rubrisoli]QBD74633.1 LacI family transcriptional regulator [Ktedonosporobacter rubrisoli]
MVEKINATNNRAASEEVTIDVVAQMAGVSPATVSRVINNRPVVSKMTRQRVLEAMTRLNYQPGTQGRPSAMPRMRTLGVVIADIANPFYAEIVRGIEETALLYGLNIVLYDTLDNAEREAQFLSLLEERQTDGLIICASCLPEQRLRSLLREEIPVVFINHLPLSASLGTVEIDQEAGIRAAMQHLVDLGHRRIAFVGGTPGAQIYQRRLATFRATCAEAGMAIPENYVVPGKPTLEGGRETAHELLKSSIQPERAKNAASPTALLAYNDLVAVGAMIAAQEAGLVVPDQLSIVGYDNIPFAGLLQPALTTVQQPARVLGEQAMQLITSYLQAHALPENGPTFVRLTPTLIVRASTAPAPAQ